MLLSAKLKCPPPGNASKGQVISFLVYDIINNLNTELTQLYSPLLVKWTHSYLKSQNCSIVGVMISKLIMLFLTGSNMTIILLIALYNLLCPLSKAFQ